MENEIKIHCKTRIDNPTIIDFYINGQEEPFWTGQCTDSAIPNRLANAKELYPLPIKMQTLDLLFNKFIRNNKSLLIDKSYDAIKNKSHREILSIYAKETIQGIDYKQKTYRFLDAYQKYGDGYFVLTTDKSDIECKVEKSQKPQPWDNWNAGDNYSFKIHYKSGFVQHNSSSGGSKQMFLRGFSEDFIEKFYPKNWFDEGKINPNEPIIEQIVNIESYKNNKPIPEAPPIWWNNKGYVFSNKKLERILDELDESIVKKEV